MGINYIFQMIRTNEMNKKFKREKLHEILCIILLMVFLSEITRLLLILYIVILLVYFYIESRNKYNKKNTLENEVDSLAKIEEKNKVKKFL